MALRAYVVDHAGVHVHAAGLDPGLAQQVQQLAPAEADVEHGGVPLEQG